MPDSSTGGYLAPTSTGGDLNDQALQDFLQGIVVGITGMAGNLVRPRFQKEPPDPPDIDTTWAAIGPGQRDREPFSALVRKSQSTIVVRNRTLEIICSFYGPEAETMGEMFAMGLDLPQNREGIQYANGQLTGFNLVGGVTGPVIAPALVKSQWRYRADYTFKLRQQQQYTYPVLTVEKAQATLETQPPGQAVINVPIAVNAPE
jgi:hypothetical protein